MSLTTYRGIVRNGKIEPTPAVDLPEGSEVYVVVPSGITAQIAKRKANGWLVGYVGNMLMADHGELVQVGSFDSPAWVWRFEVFVTSLIHDPSGPIGTLDVDAASGAIVDGDQTKAMLYERGRTSQHPL
jgi:hypothetical protein